MNKSRLIFLVLIASLFAYMLACSRFAHPAFGPDGMSDGGGLL